MRRTAYRMDRLLPWWWFGGTVDGGDSYTVPYLINTCGHSLATNFGGVPCWHTSDAEDSLILCCHC